MSEKNKDKKLMNIFIFGAFVSLFIFLLLTNTLKMQEININSNNQTNHVDKQLCSTLIQDCSDSKNYGVSHIPNIQYRLAMIMLFAIIINLLFASLYAIYAI